MPPQRDRSRFCAAAPDPDPTCAGRLPASRLPPSPTRSSRSGAPLRTSVAYRAAWKDCSSGDAVLSQLYERAAGPVRDGRAGGRRTRRRRRSPRRRSGRRPGGRAGGRPAPARPPLRARPAATGAAGALRQRRRSCGGRTSRAGRRAWWTSRIDDRAAGPESEDGALHRLRGMMAPTARQGREDFRWHHQARCSVRRSHARSGWSAIF